MTVATCDSSFLGDLFNLDRQGMGIMLIQTAEPKVTEEERAVGEHWLGLTYTTSQNYSVLLATLVSSDTKKGNNAQYSSLK